jgi:hypothetical protein
VRFRTTEEKQKLTAEVAERGAESAEISCEVVGRTATMLRTRPQFVIL